MGQALYRKYRPKSLKEVVGQEHITQTLEQALKQGRISHAYLFTGPRGVGKTSVARILAHEINGLPYDNDSVHLDIIEIDAASNRRIDEIRELRDKVYVAPTSAKYKVYIIDEVHMLTREAFNALLKTLEEPPAHAIFILATTDAHKVPETIISRTQRFSFRPGEPAKLVANLKQIAKAEKIKISDEALELLAEHGDGSFRDSVSLLDQANSHGESVELADAQRLLGLPPGEAVTTLLSETMASADSATLMKALNELYDQGYQAATIAKQLGQTIRRNLLGNAATYDHQAALELLAQLIEVPVAHDPERFLEITILQSRPQQIAKPKPIEPAIVADEVSTVPEAVLETAPKPTPTPALKPKAAEPKANGTAKFDASLWPALLHALKQRHNTLYGVVRMAQPDFSDNALKLAFAFPFHQKRINETSNRQLLSDIVEELTGQRISIECVVDSTVNPPEIVVVAEPTPATADLSTINNIFGSAELLES